jgi:hypothetical protein
MKGDLPLLHLPEGTKTKFNQNDKREFSAWVKKFIKEFEQTNSTMMDVTRPLLDKLLPEDRAEISKQKRAYKDFFNYLYPNHVFPRQVTYRPAPPAPLPSQVAGKRPAQAQQAQKPTHKVVAVARELSNFFNGLSQKGMYVDSSGIAWIQRNNFAKQFDLFLDDLDDKKGNFSGCDPDSMFTFGTNTNLLCEFFEDKELLQKTRTMHFDDEILLGFYSGVKDNNVQNFFQGYMDDVDKGRVVKSLADIFKDVAEEIQAIIDQGQKMKSDSQIQKNALAAAKQVLEKDGASNADIADARTAVHAIRDQILNGVYAMETTNNNQIKVQFAAALMAYNADATDPTATLFFLLQKIIAVIPLPHFRKLVTASDLFKDALALYKELSKPPAAEGGAAAGGRPARQGMLPGVAAAPVAPAPHVAPRAAGGGGGGDDDWADGGEEDYQPTPEDIQNVMDMLERRKKASAGGNQGFFSGAGDDGWTDAGRGGQPRGKARLPDYSEGGGSNLAPGGTGFFGSGNRFEVLQDHRDPGAMPQRPRSRPARGELTDAPEATDVDLDIPEPAGGAAVAAIEETAAEERAASAAGSARSGRSASASAGGSSGRASSRSRSRARSESAGEPQRDEAVVPEQSDVTTTRAKSASAITSVERYNAWLMENPYASFEEKSAARMRFASMSSNLTLEEFHAMCDKAEQSLKFKQLSEKYEEYD